MTKAMTRIEALSLAIARHFEPEPKWVVKEAMHTSIGGWWVMWEAPVARPITDPEIFVRLLKALLDAGTVIVFRKSGLEAFYADGSIDELRLPPEEAVAEASVKAFGVKVEPL